MSRLSVGARRCQRAVASLVACLALAGPVLADNLGVVRARASAGDPRAVTQLAIAYYFGRGVEADLPRARELLDEAREGGDTLALALLGVDALRRQEVPLALELLRQAAAAGHALAQRQLGAMYLGGLGVAVDVSAGRAILEAAVAQGDAPAMLALGLHLRELGADEAPTDHARGLRLIRRAAALGEPLARVHIAEHLLEENTEGAHEDAAFFLRASGVMTNNTAWLLATSPEEDKRDGERAVRLMEALLEEPTPRRPEWVDTLAAAYAEAGRFEEAATTQAEAIALLEEGSNAAMVDGMRERLDTYQNDKPYREAPP
ncbi:MAG: tetratricopeptide repeat protein [Pseudomonadota bacterium]